MFRRSESTAPGRAPTAGAAWLALGLLATLATTSAQDAGAELTPLELFGSAEWLIESVSSGGETLEPGAEVPTELRLVVDLPALAGTAGCNRMTAHFELGPGAGAIDFEPIVATLMACPEPAMAQERTVFDALETVTTYDRQQGRVVLSGPGVEVVLAARAPGGIATTPWRRLEIDAFNQAVGVAAASGASWPADPLRVALAFVDLSAALETTVSLSYGRPGARQGPEGDRSAANVNVVESGFLDDAVTGATQRVTLERRANHWVVTGHERVWHCARGPDPELVEPLRCP